VCIITIQWRCIPQAYTSFSKAIRSNGKVSTYFLARAEVAKVLGKWDLVRVDAEAALALNPGDGKARAMLQLVVPQ
jgi:Tfp pilus assembly protein PilF